ncbi:CheW protein [Singulisphaera sp. GP187]|uniref:chemotaxis protein CheW n=1 Tax=Singulisphaera sp. GP187 TaxID=1882752 RepID=UPI0009263794|nr:chemotaxis protein CheW [Singulisphaera sp. GP187]SIO56718.1 CheW protein [Singulisphaera sp. GP187]
MTTHRQLCTFRLDDHLYGVDVARILEILRAPAVTGVPLASSSVRGLINLRGQVITALDLRYRLGLGAASTDSALMALVVRDEEDAVILLVDHVEDVLEVDEAGFETTPDTLPGAARALIQGAYKLEDQLLLLLDIDEAVKLATDSPEFLA